MRDDTTVVTWVIKTFFCIVLLSISSWSLLLLLGLYHFCPFFGPSLDGMFLWYFQFSWRDFYSFPLSCYHLYLFSVHWKRPSLVSPCYSLKLHLVGCTLPFLPCFSLLFFPQLFVKPPQTTTSPSRISFPLGCFCSLPAMQYYRPLSIVLQALSLLDLIPWISLSPPLHIHRGFDLRCTWLA